VNRFLRIWREFRVGWRRPKAVDPRIGKGKYGW